MEYIIIQWFHAPSVADKVNEKLKEWWVLYWDLWVGKSPMWECFAQAMVLHEAKQSDKSDY